MEYLKILQDALTPFPRLTPAEWCEHSLSLPASVSNKSGKLKLQPWFIDIINQLENRDITEINIQSSAQIGKSTLMMAMLLYGFSVWKAPSMVVFPVQSEAESLLRRRLLPIIKESPTVEACRLTGKDNKDVNEIFGINCSIKAGWAGSASSLASVACRLVVSDETSKYNDNCGGEADPVSLMSARVASYRRIGAKVVCMSTPVTDQGTFHNQYQKGLIHEWYFMCPHCNKLSFPTWQNIRWTKDKAVKDICNLDVKYRCEHCEKELSEKEYRKAIRNGKWIVNDANAEEKPITSVSYQLSGLLSEHYSFEFLVREFLKSKDNPATYQHFTNSILGLPWIEKRIEIKETAISKLILHDLPALQVPPETMKIVAGIDVGGQPGLEPDENGKGLHFWITLLAVHPAGKYSVIYTGRQMGFTATMKFLSQELYCPSLDKSYFVSQAYCDSGYETESIYSVALKNNGLIACDGHQTLQEPVKYVNVDAINGAFGKKRYLGGNINKANVDTTYFKDRLWSLIANEHIHFASNIHEDTAKHISSEVKRPVNKKGLRFVYTPKYKGIESHTLDSTVYALACSFAAADYRYNSWSEWEMVNIPPDQPVQQPNQQPIQDQPEGTSISPW